MTAMDFSKSNGISIFSILFLSIIVSLYFFPFGFTFLPQSFNTKIGLAVLGIAFVGIHCAIRRSVQIDGEVAIAAAIAFIFGLVGFIACDINHTADYAYASYIASFGTWLSAAYATFCFIRFFHPNVTIKLIINYLAFVCVVQCILALIIDNVPAVKQVVDAYISQDTIADVKFLNDVKRLYGIGAALDPAGTRFSIVLLAMGCIMGNNINVKKSAIESYGYWLAFIIISVVGNMISRTTLVGMAMGLFSFFILSGLLRVEINKFSVYMIGRFLLMLLVGSLVVYYLYQTNDYVYKLLRYGFEGFFNWYETGTFKTDSTDKLNNNMWVWPEDTKTWIIGRGSWAHFGPDPGYVRFIFYSGLVGMVIFSLFFVYNAIACTLKFPSYSFFFLMLLCLTFVIWYKVPTDLFLIYALFYCIDPEKKEILT
ncbi:MULTISPECIES: hypothetical protein [Sphingobacterium]|uniref:hypothetical protein n=1 Tax=Sphingobacterium TaxID=28453 RepID=UPI00257AD79F|nr:MULTISPECIES: hypothetical protein [Sphingobacterium]